MLPSRISRCATDWISVSCMPKRSGERRTPTVKSLRQLARTPSTMSNSSRERFSSVPPYWSLRRFVSALRNWQST